ncbi:MAG: glycosyltransferase family 2 protein [Actinomycetota bacterium]
MCAARLPRVTVVTPSYNQAGYLKETIESVLSQGYPELEYIIMDGGSTDGSAELIESYASDLAYWQSEPDAGQSDAIRRGFERGTGEILAWLNSDDTYEPGTLHRIGATFAEQRDAAMVYGDYFVLYPDGRKVLKRKIGFDFKICLYSYLMIPQPSSFWRADAYKAVGGLDPAFRFAMDYDFFLRMGARFEDQVVHIREPFSTFRVHPTSKSVAEQDSFGGELRQIRQRFFSGPRWSWKLRKYLYLLKAQSRFVIERGTLPLRKDRAKA